MPRLSAPSCSPQGCPWPVADGCGSTRAQLLLFQAWLTPPRALQDGAESGSSVRITQTWFLPLSHFLSATSLAVDPESTPFNQSCGPKCGAEFWLGEFCCFLSPGHQNPSRLPRAALLGVMRNPGGFPPPPAWGLFGFLHS